MTSEGYGLGQACWSIRESEACPSAFDDTSERVALQQALDALVGADAIDIDMSDTNDMRADFEAWWEANINIEDMDLHRHMYPGGRGDWSYACHETHRSWLTWQASTERATAKWFPIETAPQDGSDVMLSNGSDVAQGHWLYREGGITECRDADGCYIDQREDEGYAGWVDFVGGMLPDPTHWMPLLPPPAIRQGSET